MNTNGLQTNDRKDAEEATQMNTPPMHTDHLAHEEHDLSTATSLACFVEFRHARERLLAQFRPVAAVVESLRRKRARRQDVWRVLWAAPTR
jgi:hypothetical protein